MKSKRGVKLMAEYWDLYDEHKNKLAKVVKRGDKLNDNEYHLVTNAWIKNSKGEFLISQRSANKTHPLMWECTGGSALKGEDTYEAAIREAKEEMGVDISNFKYKFIGSAKRYYPNCPDILEVWLFYGDIDIGDVIIQGEEVNDVMWASKEKIMELYENGKFEATNYFEEVINS